jgi:hypothetical protein
MKEYNEHSGVHFELFIKRRKRMVHELAVEALFKLGYGRHGAIYFRVASKHTTRGNFCLTKREK